MTIYFLKFFQLDFKMLMNKKTTLDEYVDEVTSSSMAFI